jgi:hypothetical protein
MPTTFKIAFIVLSLVLSNASSFCQTTDVRQLEWLVGSWRYETDEGFTVETWRRLSERTLEGEAIVESKADGKKRQSEALLIAAMGDAVFYLPRPLQNPSPVAFRLVSPAGDAAVFENPAHDFPQRIVYRRESQRTIRVTLETVASDPNQRFEIVLQKLE